MFVEHESFRVHFASIFSLAPMQKTGVADARVHLRPNAVRSRREKKKQLWNLHPWKNLL